MKSNSVITHEIGDQRITFTVVGVGDMVLDLTKLNTAIIQRAAMHGMIQRISDAAAISRDPETGKPATPQEKYDAMAALVAHYKSGTSEWSRVSAGTGEPKGQIFRALAVIYPNQTPERLREWFSGKTKNDQKVIRKSSKVRDAIATFTDGSAGDAILEELDNA